MEALRRAAMAIRADAAHAVPSRGRGSATTAGPRLLLREPRGHASHPHPKQGTCIAREKGGSVPPASRVTLSHFDLRRGITAVLPARRKAIRRGIRTSRKSGSGTVHLPVRVEQMRSKCTDDKGGADPSISQGGRISESIPTATAPQAAAHLRAGHERCRPAPSRASQPPPPRRAGCEPRSATRPIVTLTVHLTLHPHLPVIGPPPTANGARRGRTPRSRV